MKKRVMALLLSACMVLGMEVFMKGSVKKAIIIIGVLIVLVICVLLNLVILQAV